MPPQPTLITAAVEAEIGPLVRWLGLRRDKSHRIGSGLLYGGVDPRVFVLVTGMGGPRAGRLLGLAIEELNPARVVITGFAGAADPAYAVGQIVTPIEILDGVTGNRYKPSLPCDAWRTLYTSATLVQTPAAKRMVFKDHQAAAVDMESAALAACCDARRVPWVCVRAVSDSAEMALPAFLMKMTHPDGRSNLPAAVAHALTHPWHIPTMVRVGRHAKKAAEALATAVQTAL